jgi:predicted acetyltransferase
MLKLVKPSHEYMHAFKETMQEQRTDIGTRLYTPGVLKLIEMIDSGHETEWLKNIEQQNDITLFWLMDDSRYVGCFTFRHNLTEQLIQRGGNLGYNIIPSQRRRGFAFVGLSLVLEQAYKMGFDKILITCGTDNDKSYALIKKAVATFGGEFLPVSERNEYRAWVNTAPVSVK